MPKRSRLKKAGKYSIETSVTPFMIGSWREMETFDTKAEAGNELKALVDSTFRIKKKK